MADIVIPANTQAYLTVIRDDEHDKFDVVDFVYNYLNSSILDGIYGYWKMEETSGTRMDSSDNANNWNITGSPPPGYVAGKIDNAFHPLSNSQGLYEDPMSWWPDGVSSPSADVEYTFAFWLYMASGTDTELDFNANLGIMAFGYSGYWEIEASTNNRYASTNHDLSLDAWHLVIIQGSSAGLYIYVDGVLEGSDESSPESVSDAGVMWLFCGNAPDNGNVYVDELGIWNRLLTEGERDQLWNGGAGVSLY